MVDLFKFFFSSLILSLIQSKPVHINGRMASATIQPGANFKSFATAQSAKTVKPSSLLQLNAKKKTGPHSPQGNTRLFF